MPRGDTTTTPVPGTQAITRALDVLGVLGSHSGDVGISAISEATGLQQSTVHRILRALIQAGYVAQHQSREGYRLGRQAFLLGSAAASDLGINDVRPVLEAVAARTEESANLVLRDGAEGVVVLRVESSLPLRFTQPVGSRIPLHCTSTGKCLLAYSYDPEAEVAALGALRPHTPQTLTDPADLLADLAGTRERGFAVNVEERHAGVCGVAAPVRAVDGQLVAALAIQGPTLRLGAERRTELGAIAVEAAAQIGTLLPPDYRL